MRFKKTFYFLSLLSLSVPMLLLMSCSTNIIGKKSTFDEYKQESKTLYTGGTGPIANFEVKLVNNWNGIKTHTFIPGRHAHFQNIVWDLNNQFWKNKTKASSEFAKFATTGKISSHNVIHGNLPFHYTYTFSIKNINYNSQTLPSFTFASRLGPSPDWFVGLSAFPLVSNKNHEWLTSAKKELWLYSAGVTDQRYDSKKAGLIVQPPKDKSGKPVPLGYLIVTKK